MKKLIAVFVSSFFLTLLFGLLIIPVLRKIKVGQPIYEYVTKHKNKNGTPTMGGLFTIIPVSLIFFLFGGYNSRIATVSVWIGLAFMVVGFLDDFIKIRFEKNEGLKPYQKIIFQVFIAVLAGVFVWHNGITQFNVPFSKSSISVGIFSIPIVALIFIATTNSVNLTDGLDGLAGSVCVVYLTFFSLLIYLQSKSFSNFLSTQETLGVFVLCFSLVGGLLAFLVFNFNKASVFMGDTGSLSLGGFISALGVFSANGFFIPLLGITFVISSISVIVQVVYFKRTKKRVFLMAPFHHHLELKGLSEGKITFIYSLLTVFFGILTIYPYL